jgi:hypothetical protein
MHHMLKLVKESMQNAQDWTKFYKNKISTPWDFEVKDWIFLRVKPYYSGLKLGKC